MILAVTFVLWGVDFSRMHKVIEFLGRGYMRTTTNIHKLGDTVDATIVFRFPAV